MKQLTSRNRKIQFATEITCNCLWLSILKLNWNCSRCKKDWLSWLQHFHIFFQVLQSVPCWSFGSQKKSKVWDKKIDAEVQVSSISTSFKHGFFWERRVASLVHETNKVITKAFDIFKKLEGLAFKLLCSINYWVL